MGVAGFLAVFCGPTYRVRAASLLRWNGCRTCTLPPLTKHAWVSRTPARVCRRRACTPTTRSDARSREDADHTKGTRAEVLRAAKATGVSVVMWTDHPPVPTRLRGPACGEGVLFIAGSRTTICCAFHRSRRAAFSLALEETPGRDPRRLSGHGVYNRHTDARTRRPSTRISATP